MREYGLRPGDTGGATYGTPWGATTNGQSVVGVSLGQLGINPACMYGGMYNVKGRVVVRDRVRVKLTWLTRLRGLTVNTHFSRLGGVEPRQRTQQRRFA